MRLTLLARLAATALFAGLACGSVNGGPAAERLNGLSPSAAIKQSLQELNSESYRSTSEQKTTFDTTQMPSGVAQTMPREVTATGTSEVANAGRRKISVETSAPSRKFYLVLYDGAIYYSADGKTYKEATFLNSLAGQLTTQLNDYADHLQDVQDRGRTTESGAAAEHYVATLDPSYFASATKQVTSGLGLDPAVSESVTSAMKVESSSFDFYVRRQDAQLLRTTSSLTMSVDVGQLAAKQGAAAPPVAGVLKITSSSTSRFRDQGAKISVAKPASSGQLTPAEFAQQASA